MPTGRSKSKVSFTVTLPSARATGRPPLPAITVRPRLEVKPADTANPGRILRPEDLDPFKNLLLFARSIVEGWFSGKHRSLDFGSNAEFAEYKAYVPGDPVTHLDWKVWARSRRLVVRKFREEKDMTGYLVVDMSGSMAYHADRRESKQTRAARLAASLAYLMQRQGDKPALALFNTGLVKHLPPGGTRRHLHDLISTLEQETRKPRGHTSAHRALDLCVPLFRKRGSLVIISDFFTELDGFFDALAQFQHRGFRTLLLHVMDPDERLLPDVPLARFIDMESRAEVQVAPDEIRAAYRREMDALVQRLTEESQRRGMEYYQLKTEEPYLTALEAWLALRGKGKAR